MCKWLNLVFIVENYLTHTLFNRIGTKTSVCGSQLVSLSPLLIVSTKIWAWHGNWKLLLIYCIKQKKGLGLSFWGKIGFDELLAFLKRNALMNCSGILYLKYIEMAHNLIGSIVKNWNELRKSIVKLEL